MSHFPETAFRKFLATFQAPTAPQLRLGVSAASQLRLVPSTANTVGGTDTVGHSSVQAWSAGDIFPAVISTVESYAPGEGSLADRLRWSAYALILDGREERYASYQDARAVAQRLLADPIARAAWRAAEED